MRQGPQGTPSRRYSTAMAALVVVRPWGLILVGICLGYLLAARTFSPEIVTALTVNAAIFAVIYAFQYVKLHRMSHRDT